MIFDKLFKNSKGEFVNIIDILLGTKSRFEERKEIPSVENEVYRKGVLLYDAGNQRVV